MSVTFAPVNPGAVKQVEIMFSCNKKSDVLSPAPENFHFIADSHSIGCLVCQNSGGAFCNIDYEGGSMNISNGNAVTILEALGLESNFESGLFGTVPAEDFLGRVLMAIAIAPEDEGRPTFQDHSITFCGTEPGYLQTRLAKLHEIALWAVENKTEVSWG